MFIFSYPFSIIRIKGDVPLFKVSILIEVSRIFYNVSVEAGISYFVLLNSKLFNNCINHRVRCRSTSTTHKTHRILFFLNK